MHIDDIELFGQQVESFNKTSTHQIHLEVRWKRHEELAVGHLWGFPMVRIQPNLYEFTFNMVSAENIEIAIILLNENYADEGFKLSKLICEKENIRLKIHHLIENNCSSIIKEYNRDSNEWVEHLSNWLNNCTVSVYKTYNEAFEARERFCNSFDRVLKNHLKQYHPEVIEKIKALNKRLSKVSEDIKESMEKVPIRIERSFNHNFVTLYSLS